MKRIYLALAALSLSFGAKATSQLKQEIIDTIGFPMTKITLNGTGLYIGKAGFIRIIETPLEKNKILRVFGKNKSNDLYIEISKSPLASINSDKEITLKMTKKDLGNSSFKYSGTAQLSNLFTATLTKKNGKEKNVLIEKIDTLINKPLKSLLNPSSEKKLGKENKPTQNQNIQEIAPLKIEDQTLDDENDFTEAETNSTESKQDIITTSSQTPSSVNSSIKEIYSAIPPLPNTQPTKIVNSIIDGNKILLPTFGGDQMYDETLIDSAELDSRKGGIYLYYNGGSIRKNNANRDDFVFFDPASNTYLAWGAGLKEFTDQAEKNFYDTSRIPKTLTVCLKSYLPKESTAVDTFTPKREIRGIEEVQGYKSVN